MNRKSQHGVALVITLVMLAIVTVMAVLFLGMSRRERASVTLSANLTDAKLANDSAAARAVAEVVARITVQSNLFAYDFMVSTNFTSANGFIPGRNSPTNASYVYASNGKLLNNDADIRQNQNNLFYDPRPPVFIVTNFATGASEFRFYLDLNRNRRFDTNGYQRVFDTNGVVTGQTGFYWGDPEWIGILERPDLPHSPTNRFIGRYAFVVVPAGRTLDINYLHNNAKRLPDLTTLGFFRNQGVGSWEINLAAFLRDLNTNVWNSSSYVYIPLNNPPEGGYAFRDALSILNYRYQNKVASLKSVNQAFGPLVGNIFKTGQIDIYSDGPLVLGIRLTNDVNNPLLPWSGSYNTNGYSSVQELFDPAKTSTSFVRELTNAVASKGTYDQTTFYRLLSQLGTDSLPANRNKLNLNYDNVNTNTGAIDPSLTANFRPWTPLRFFTNAADLMLRSQSSNTLAISRIPVYPVNRYSSDVHRLLQVAANICDATTNRFPLVAGTNAVYAPSVFRPLFSRDGTNIFISDYVEVIGTNFLRDRWVDLNNPLDRNSIAQGTTNTVNVYGVPLVIGVKKGLPNFNEVLLQSSVQVTRRMQAFKTDRKAIPTFQQAYEIGVSNHIALEAWNSYAQAFPQGLEMMIVTNHATVTLTHQDSTNPGAAVYLLATNNIGSATNITVPSWGGKQFRVPLDQVVISVPNQEFHFRPNRPHLEPLKPSVSFDDLPGFPIPGWKLNVTNRVVFALVARDQNLIPHIIDFVNLGNMVGGMDISRALVGATNAFGDGDGGTDRSGMFWRPERIGSGSVNPKFAPANATWGITNQLFVSLTNALSLGEWNEYSRNPIDGQQREKAIDNFRKFLGLPPMFYPEDTNVPPVSHMQVPFTPTRKLDQQLSWQVNDPLVHYTAADLYDQFYADTNNVQALKPAQASPANNIGQVNGRFSPWGGKPGKEASGDPLAFNVAIKDPLIVQSDDWDFPTNKFPNLGWLGRVHRGTPWQTVYLKSAVEPTNSWGKWAGSFFTHPTNDWHLVGLFTTAVNDNAARGLLSVNQTNTAAWSAVLSGVSVLTNALANPRLGAVPAYSSLFIEPATWQLQSIVTNINSRRLQQPGQTFQDLGSVLAAETLTVGSPYLNASGNQGKYGIRDEVYERIPQQILSLIKEDEPYVVIYAFGQALRPAENSVVKTPGPFRGLCTNYQVTGEVVTKTAARIVRPQPAKPKVFKAVVESYNILPAD